MKTMVRMLAIGMLVGCSVASAGDKKDKDKGKKEPPAPPAVAAVAIVAGTPITAEELDTMVAPRLVGLRNQEYELKRQALEEAIAKRLMEGEAKTRSVSVDELIKAEVTDKSQAVPPEEVKAFFDSNKPRMGNMTEVEALLKIETWMRDQRSQKRRQDFLKELRAKAAVKVMLDPPRASVEVGPNPVKGPATAPVTIVEFSDYQCPYCSKVEVTMKQLQEKYGDKLRVAFRDFPLVDIHKDAARAAEAAACANEQGKYWEMHDKMFANQGGLSADGLKKMAGEIGLAADPFAQCLESGKHTALWKKETEAGARNGVTGTPGFFINGRFLNGSKPIEEFSQIIDEELERAASAASAKTK